MSGCTGRFRRRPSPAGTFVKARSYAAINGVPDFNNFTPRFGLAWDVTGKGKTVLKASANRYMQGLDMNLVKCREPAGIQHGERAVDVHDHCRHVHRERPHFEPVKPERVQRIRGRRHHPPRPRI